MIDNNETFVSMTQFRFFFFFFYSCNAEIGKRDRADIKSTVEWRSLRIVGADRNFYNFHFLFTTRPWR